MKTVLFFSLFLVMAEVTGSSIFLEPIDYSPTFSKGHSDCPQKKSDEKEKTSNLSYQIKAILPEKIKFVSPSFSKSRKSKF